MVCVGAVAKRYGLLAKWVSVEPHDCAVAFTRCDWCDLMFYITWKDNEGASRGFVKNMHLVIASKLKFPTFVGCGVGKVDGSGEFSDGALKFGEWCYV